ncbi:unnamed protein product [Durusdinium trenchii]|uniref:Uncharacterized protein n=1 Tax=Durusdinium trenchii TaxID=1381693 RepID=A0ABP0QKG8_9DINO
MLKFSTDSWVDVEPFQPWEPLRRTWWQTQVWFRETTDSVVLNSPWLRRSTGRVVCVGWIGVHFVRWCIDWSEAMHLHRNENRVNLFGLRYNWWVAFHLVVWPPWFAWW